MEVEIKINKFIANGKQSVMSEERQSLVEGSLRLIASIEKRFLEAAIGKEVSVMNKARAAWYKILIAMQASTVAGFIPQDDDEQDQQILASSLSNIMIEALPTYYATKGFALERVVKEITDTLSSSSYSLSYKAGISEIDEKKTSMLIRGIDVEINTY